MPTALIDSPELGAQAAAAAGGSVTILIERLLVLAEYRNRGFGKATLQFAVMDAAQRVAGNPARPLSKASLFVPSTMECMPAAKSALSIGMKTVGSERPDPTGWWTETPTWEFSVPGESLMHALAAAAAATAAAAAAAAQPRR